MQGQKKSTRVLKDFDWSLLAAALLLSTISLVEIYSSTMTLRGDYFLRQLAWVGVGVIALFIVSNIDYHLFSEQIPWFYLASLGALFYVLAFGKTVSSS